MEKKTLINNKRSVTFCFALVFSFVLIVLTQAVSSIPQSVAAGIDDWTSATMEYWSFDDDTSVLSGDMTIEKKETDITVYSDVALSDAYVVSATVTMSESYITAGTSGVYYKAGIIPFYVDSNNYFHVWIQQWGNDSSARIVARGKRNGQNFSSAAGDGYIDGAFFANLKPVTESTTFMMWCEVTSNAVRVYLDNERIATYDAPSALPISAQDSFQYGFVLRNGKAEFSDIQVLDGSHMIPIVSSIGGGWESDNESAWDFDDTSSVLTGDSVSETTAYKTGNQKEGYAVVADVSMADSHVDAGTSGVYFKAGLMPFYINSNNYFQVWVQQWGNDASARLVALGKVGGKNFIGSNDWGYFDGAWLVDFKPVSEVTDFTMRCEVLPSVIHVYIDDVYMTSYKAPSDLAIGTSDAYAGYGFVVQNGVAEFSSIALLGKDSLINGDGDEIGGGWTSDNSPLWTHNDGALAADAKNATTAYKAIDYREGYVVSAKISMTDSYVEAGTSGVLYKAGIIPFYVDNNNFIQVWIQQYGNDANSRITARGKVNGQNLLETNEFGFWDGPVFDLLKPVTEAVEFTMRCEVTEFSVVVYVDGEFVASINSVEPLGILSDEAAVNCGLIAENGKVGFGDILIQNKESVLKTCQLTVLVINEKQEKMIGANVKAGNAAMTDNGDGTYTAEVNVRTSVTVTIDMDGYERRVYKIDSAEVVSPTMEKQIVIYEPEQAQQIPDYGNENTSGCGAKAGGTFDAVYMFGIAFVLGAAVLVVCKKRKSRK